MWLLFPMTPVYLTYLYTDWRQDQRQSQKIKERSVNPHLSLIWWWVCGYSDPELVICLLTSEGVRCGIIVTSWIDPSTGLKIKTYSEYLHCDGTGRDAFQLVKHESEVRSMDYTLLRMWRWPSEGGNLVETNLSLAVLRAARHFSLYTPVTRDKEDSAHQDWEEKWTFSVFPKS